MLAASSAAWGSPASGPRQQAAESLRVACQDQAEEDLRSDAAALVRLVLQRLGENANDELVFGPLGRALCVVCARLRVPENVHEELHKGSVALLLDEGDKAPPEALRFWLWVAVSVSVPLSRPIASPPVFALPPGEHIAALALSALLHHPSLSPLCDAAGAACHASARAPGVTALARLVAAHPPDTRRARTHALREAMLLGVLLRWGCDTGDDGGGKDPLPDRTCASVLAGVRSDHAVESALATSVVLRALRGGDVCRFASVSTVLCSLRAAPNHDDGGGGGGDNDGAAGAAAAAVVVVEAPLGPSQRATALLECLRTPLCLMWLRDVATTSRLAHKQDDGNNDNGQEDREEEEGEEEEEEEEEEEGKQGGSEGRQQAPGLASWAARTLQQLASEEPMAWEGNLTALARACELAVHSARYAHVVGTAATTVLREAGGGEGGGEDEAGAATTAATVRQLRLLEDWVAVDWPRAVQRSLPVLKVLRVLCMSCFARAGSKHPAVRRLVLRCCACLGLLSAATAHPDPAPSRHVVGEDVLDATVQHCALVLDTAMHGGASVLAKRRSALHGALEPMFESCANVVRSLAAQGGRLQWPLEAVCAFVAALCGVVEVPIAQEHADSAVCGAVTRDGEWWGAWVEHGAAPVLRGLARCLTPDALECCCSPQVRARVVALCAGYAADSAAGLACAQELAGAVVVAAGRKDGGGQGGAQDSVGEALRLALSEDDGGLLQEACASLLRTKSAVCDLAVERAVLAMREEEARAGEGARLDGWLACVVPVVQYYASPIKARGLRALAHLVAVAPSAWRARSWPLVVQAAKDNLAFCPDTPEVGDAFVRVLGGALRAARDGGSSDATSRIAHHFAGELLTTARYLRQPSQMVHSLGGLRVVVEALGEQATFHLKPVLALHRVVVDFLNASVHTAFLQLLRALLVASPSRMLVHLPRLLLLLSEEFVCVEAMAKAEVGGAEEVLACVLDTSRGLRSGNPAQFDLLVAEMGRFPELRTLAAALASESNGVVA